MPELPDIVVYIEALEKRLQGVALERIQISSPFLLRTAVPPLTSLEGKVVIGIERLGKRICFRFEGDLWLVLHLMIAGRLHWYEDPARAKKARGLAVFEFTTGTLVLTEAGTKKRASLHLVEGRAGLEKLNPGGLEVFDANLAQFTTALQERNHTLKRALTDPRILSGIGNAYSDEILFEARLSPFAVTQKLTSEETERLFAAVKSCLTAWVDRLRTETGDTFPEKVTAFRPEMATHGKYKEACPRCGSKIQRIRYASNETNYCPNCQTGGKLLADRALSQLLKKDWPRSPEELESLTRQK
ncbi:MAG TPA: DNA-formamidopyrimidine glycosylase family protein [Pyrinomonadaceae bacterium]|jgi:formamidopyrimidine-DNA glycosylase|nr:DNA-formamidopyrimidine glycosylase family protein [Pyrinomonadaceae bacterium]